jgi:hypothetical protein
VGDFVRPKADRRSTTDLPPCVFGRVVADMTGPGSGAPRSRDAGTVAVEFVDRSFAEAGGLSSPVSSDASPVLETRRARQNKLVYSSCSDIVSCFIREDVTSMYNSDQEESINKESSMNGLLGAKIKAVSRLDRSAIDSIAKECKGSAETLARLFSAGLPEAIISAIDVAENDMNQLNPPEDLSEKIFLVGKLALVIAGQLFRVAKDFGIATGGSDEGFDVPPDERSALAHSLRSTGSGIARTNASRRNRVREVIARREAFINEEQNFASSSQNSNDLLQQRRNILLTLMSRARRGDPSFFTDPLGRENGLFNGDLSVHDTMPPLSFGSQAAWEDATAAFAAFDGGNRLESDEQQHVPTRSTQKEETSRLIDTDCLLNSALRSRNDDFHSLSRGTGASQATFARHLVSSGILTNNLRWIEALVDAQAKKSQIISVQKASSVLRETVDDEGTRILHLAVSLGCSIDVLTYIISRGASVRQEDIRKAALTHQPQSLALLLRHSSIADATIESEFSDHPYIHDVFEKAKSRHEKLHCKMRDEAVSFMVELVTRFIQFGLTSGRRQFSRVELCTQTIAEVFIGNVLLGSLQKAQQPPATAECMMERTNEVHELSGRYGPEGVLPGGLLGTLPKTIIRKALLSDADSMAAYLCLTEDHLSRKDMDSSAAGLTLLASLLNAIPELRTSSDMQRYGMADLISFHAALAARRIDSNSENLSARPADAVLDSSSSLNQDCVNILLCPKKHTAVIHITRHSSFRCDICASGVERGRPMHGCR